MTAATPPCAGFVPSSPSHPVLPSGGNEVPHLLYLLTLVPLMMLTSLTLFVLHTPFCALYFAASVRGTLCLGWITQLQF